MNINTANISRTSQLLQNFEKDTLNINDYRKREPINLPTLEEVRAAKQDIFEPCLDVSKIEMVKIKCVYERDYTANDALSNTWLASSKNSSLCWYESGSKVSDEAVRGMSKAEFLDYVRQNGLDKEINWVGVERNFNTSVDFENFSEFTDYAAAMFAGLESRIKSDFSGDEQKAQLEIMNALYDKVAKDFAGRYGRGYDESDEVYYGGVLGVKLPEGKLEASIRAVMNGKKAAYTEFIKRNKNYAGIENTEDGWLKRDVGFMTGTLKNAYKPENIRVYGDNWDEKNIIAVGMLGSMYSMNPVIEKACAKLQNMDEERIGLALAMCWLTTEKITEDLNVSDSVKDYANGLFEKYAKTLVGSNEDALTGPRSNPLGHTSSAFKGLSVKSVYAVLNVMRSTYGESGDYEKAIQKTTAFAHDTAMRKVKSVSFSQLWRYNKPIEGAIDANRFWGNFYNANSGLKYGGAMKKLLAKWDTVKDILSSGDLSGFKRKVGANMFTSFSDPSTFKGPVYGGYANG